MNCSDVTMREGEPDRVEAVKSGCSSFVRPTSVMASSASWRFLAPRSSMRPRRNYMSSSRERRPPCSA